MALHAVALDFAAHYGAWPWMRPGPSRRSLLKFEPMPPKKVVLPTPESDLFIDQLEARSRAVTAKFAAGGVTGVVTPQKVAQALISQASTIDSRLPALQQATIDWLGLTESNAGHALGEAIKAELEKPLPDWVNADVDALARATATQQLRSYQALRTNLGRLTPSVAEARVLAIVAQARAPRALAELFLDERALAEARNLCAVDPTARLRLPLAKLTEAMRDSGIEPGSVSLVEGKPRQGKVGDCFLLAAAMSMAALDPKWFEKVARVDPHSGTTVFRFYKNDANARAVPVEVTVSHQSWVDDSLKANQAAVGARGDYRFALLEMAYAKAFGGNDLNELSGGQPADAYFRLTGRSAQFFVFDEPLTVDLAGAHHHMTAWMPKTQAEGVEAAWSICTSALTKKVPLTMVLIPTRPANIARAKELGIFLEDDLHAYSLVPPSVRGLAAQWC